MFKIGRGSTAHNVNFVNLTKDSYVEFDGKKIYASTAPVKVYKEVENDKKTKLGFIVGYKDRWNNSWFIVVNQDGLSSCRSALTAVARFKILKKQQKQLVKSLI